MERESFEDEGVAGVLNNSFISIKVDREERPDIDSIYMSVCQTITGQGGWPLTIVMTPDKKPFFAGTYFPKTGTRGMPGLISILERISDMWRERKEELMETGDRITETIKNEAGRTATMEVGMDTVDAAYRGLKAMFDSRYGGFGTAPKFPTPHNLSFLLRYWKLTGKEGAREMAEKTLEAMYRGGIFDHIGFGFSRYSTDRKWLVPHFEKMLYDNALLALAYVEAYQAAGNELFREVAESIFVYVIRDMTSAAGGFYSAEDADSEGEEGKFYLWDTDQVKEAVGEKDAGVFCPYYDISSAGNFEGRSIPNLIEADLRELRDNEISPRLENIRERLFKYREGRVHPYKDDKILTGWNGLMIAAMAYGGRVLGNGEYIECAERAAGFITSTLVREDGRLLARYRDGEAAYLAYLDDYAFLVWGLLELYQATFNKKYLTSAVYFNKEMLRLFWDDEMGGLFLYGEDSEELISRPKEIYDGAMPSGNSVAAMNLQRLSRMTKDANLEEKSRRQIEAFGGEVERHPSSYTHYIMALMLSMDKTKEIVVAVNKQEDENQMLDEINDRFLPFATVLLNDGDSELLAIAPHCRGQETIGGKPTAYVCGDHSCMPPVAAVEEFEKILES